MSDMNILGQMMMAMTPNIRPWDQAVKEGAQADTALIELANLRRQQEAQQLARQYYQQNPEALMGQGGGQQMPTLATLGQPAPGAPMTQQTMLPGQAPGAAQVVSGGQDLSRFATGQPQSTIASLGPQPQPQAQPLMDLVRRNPDAAFAVLQQQQQQQDLALRREEQRLTMGTKVAEYVGRVAQGVTSPETLEQARQELARIHPQAAAQLPQTYSKEAMVPFIKKAVSVKDNATLQLETWKNQIEMQKAGLQGEPAAMVSELRTMGVNPLQATTEQRQQAQKNIQQREVEQKEREGAAAANIRTQADVAARQNQTLAEAFKGETTNLYDTNTGQTLDARMKVQDYEALPAGQVKQLSADVRKQVEQLNSAVPIVSQLQGHIDKIYGPAGVFARMTPEDLRLVNTIDPSKAGNIWDQMTKKYPELIQAQRFLDANASALARALAGETGAMNEGDIERARAMLPNLKTALNVWPPSKVGVQLPDTRAVALGTMNSLVDMINARGQTLLGNEKYQHPKLHRYQTADEAQQQTGAPGSTSERPRPQDIAPEGTPAVRLNPNLPPVPGQPTPPAAQPPAAAVPAPGPPIFPRPQIREPGAPAPGTRSQPAPAPATRPAPPTATSTPAQDEAYRQSVAPRPAPVPSAPATKPTPGRQSQAPAGTRLAGGPKYMNLEDVALAVKQTGRSRTEVEKAARSRGYIVYGSKLPLPEETMVG